MKKTNTAIIKLCVALLMLPFFYFAQANRSAIIGSYIVTSKQYNGSNVLVQSCNTVGKIDIAPNNASWGCAECILENDSTDCSAHVPSNWWTNSCSTIKVFSDSTLLDTTSCGSFCANGKLYYNDSLYFKFKFCATNILLEVMGFKIYTATNLNELSLPENALLLSPNPASDILYVQSTQYTFTEQKPVIYDMKGQIMNCSMSYVNSHTYKADVSALNAGIYFIFIQTNKGYLKKKVVVSR